MIARKSLFWLNDAHGARIAPHLPTGVRGVLREDHRRVISGIIQVRKTGCRWCDCPREYGPHTASDNRFVRWDGTRRLGEPVPKTRKQRTIRRDPDDRPNPRRSVKLRQRGRRGKQKRPLGRSHGGHNTKIHAVSDAKARLIAILLPGCEVHDCPVGRRLIKQTRPPKRKLADNEHDSADLRTMPATRGAKLVSPDKSNRNEPFAFNKRLHKLRWRIEIAIDRLKDFSRIATRYDELVRSYLASVFLVAALVWWL